MRSPLIVHHNDADGICGALILWLSTSKKAELYSIDHADEVPPDTTFENRVVYIVDFSFPRETLEHINSIATKLVLLDHHESAKKECGDLPFAHFDMDRSGARMAFDYVVQDSKLKGPFGNNPDLMDRLDLLSQYVQDKDLYKFELDNSKEVAAWMDSFPETVEAWYKLAQKFPHGSVQGSNDFNEILSEGRAILRGREKDVEKLASLHRKAVHLSDDQRVYKVAVVNAPYMFASDIGSKLVEEEDIDFACVYSMGADGKHTYQLRSNADVCDVSEVAKKFGGGGHKPASGFNSRFGADVFFDWEE